MPFWQLHKPDKQKPTPCKGQAFVASNTLFGSSVFRAQALGYLRVGLVAVFLLLVTQLVAPTHAAINEQMHFQGRLRNASQAIVPDGDYNIRFKIYSGGDGSLGGGDETLEWTETYTSTDQLRVENGYFAAQLGSITSLSTVDFTNDTLWLSIEVGGTAGTPAWDGEMDPFIRLSATPYAFEASNSDTLDGLDSSDLVQLSPGSQQTGGVNVSGNIQSGGQFQALSLDVSGEVQGGSLNIQGNGSITGDLGIDGTLTLSSLDCTVNANGGALTTNASGQVVCSDDNGGSGSGTVDSVNTLTGALTLQGTGSEIEITDNGTDTITLGLPNSVTIDTLSLTNALTVGNGGTGATTVGAAGSIAYSTGSVYDFSAQGSSGQCLLSNGAGTPSWGNCSGSGAGAVTLQKAYDNGSTVNTTNSGGNITFNLADSSTDRSFVVNIEDSATGTASINRLNGTGTVDPAYLLKLDNQDTDRSIADGLLIQAAGGGLIDAIDVSNANITNALNIGANTIQGTTGIIDFTNFDVDGTGNVTLAGTLQLSALDCTTNTNGGALTTNASGEVVCSDDDGGEGGGSTSINSLSGALTLQGTTNEIEVTDNGTETLTVGLPDDVTIGNNLTVTNDAAFNGNLTVAATNTLTLTGGTTAQRPASPTEGMLYFDTDTDTLLIYSNGKWQADRTESIIVAASDSTQAEKDSADYVADGNTGAANDGDQVQINAALTAAAGGKVYLAAGTYAVDATILVPNNTTLAGAGRGTLIELANIDTTDNLIENSDTTTGTGVVIQDLRLDGRDDLNTLGTQHGIYLNGMGADSGASAREGAVLKNTYIKAFRHIGIYLNSSSNNTVINSTIIDNTSASTVNGGITLSNSSNNNLFSNNKVSGNYRGIQITGSSYNTTLTSNLVEESAVIGIMLSSANYSTITGNTIINNGTYGMSVGSTHYSTVTGNTVKGNMTQGISVAASTYNTVAGNNIHDNGGAADNNGIHITNNSDSNTITGNTITDTSATTTNYAINISDSTSDTNYLANNTLGGGTINDSGTGTIYGGQLDGSSNYVLQGYGGALDLNGDENTSLTVDNGTNTTTIDFANPTGDVTVTFPALSPGSYDVCTSAGNCSGGGGTLQTAYNNSTSPEITVNGTNGALTVQDASTPIGANLLEVTSNGGGTTYFSVDANGISVTGTGSFSSTVSASSFDAASAAILNIGAANATSISLGQNTSVLGTFDASGAITFSSLTNCDTIDTDASGVLSCGTDATGSGGGGTVTKKLVPEYAGGTLSADGSDNSGVMSADHVTGLSSAEGYKHNYYQWETSSTTNQDYDVVVNYQLPSNFNATNEFNTSSWKIWTYTEVTTEGVITLTLEDADLGTACVASENITPSTNQTWEQITLSTNPNTNCTFNPNDIITITVKMTTQHSESNNNPVRLGEISFTYDP